MGRANVGVMKVVSEKEITSVSSGLLFSIRQRPIAELSPEESRSGRTHTVPSILMTGANVRILPDFAKREVLTPDSVAKLDKGEVDLHGKGETCLYCGRKCARIEKQLGRANRPHRVLKQVFFALIAFSLVWVEGVKRNAQVA